MDVNELLAVMVCTGLASVIGVKFREAWMRRHECPGCTTGHTAASECPDCGFPEASADMLTVKGVVVSTLFHCRSCHLLYTLPK